MSYQFGCGSTSATCWVRPRDDTKSPQLNMDDATLFKTESNFFLQYGLLIQYPKQKQTLMAAKMQYKIRVISYQVIAAFLFPQYS